MSEFYDEVMAEVAEHGGAIPFLLEHGDELLEAMYEFAWDDSDPERAQVALDFAGWLRRLVEEEQLLELLPDRDRWGDLPPVAAMSDRVLDAVLAVAERYGVDPRDETPDPSDLVAVKATEAWCEVVRRERYRRLEGLKP